MRRAFLLITLFVCLQAKAQNGTEPNAIPPVLQWQKCIGGTGADALGSILPTPDGGYITCGSSMSTDGDISNNYGYVDALVVKTDASGNIQWEKNYGGTSSESASAIIPATDGGYIFVGYTGSTDIDVTGYHPGASIGIPDVWVVKIDINGNILWQHCYGGPGREMGWRIIALPGGGYMIAATTSMNGGDVSGYHGGSHDLWLIRIDVTGNLQWQRPFGGTDNEFVPILTNTSDGGFIFGGTTGSGDGDMGCTVLGSVLWLAKFDNAGNIQWQTCVPQVNNFIVFPAEMILQSADAGYIVVGTGLSSPSYPNMGNVDAFAIKLDATGNIQWQRVMGGTNGQDGFRYVRQEADGSFVLAGSAQSTDGDICSNRGGRDIFMVKLNPDGSIFWRKNYGGSLDEFSGTLLMTPDGGYLVCGTTYSNDIDVSGNHDIISGLGDGWLLKLSFPGIPVEPTIQIEADHTDICPGQSVMFTAEITEGGNAPLFQWQLNGINTGINNDTIIINTLNDGDMVTCIITSNSPCVTESVATSNAIIISVDPSLNPRNFLFGDTAVCRYGKIDLVATGIYGSYLWNTNETTPTLTIRNPGEYWLQVTTNTGCPGRDTVIVTQKDCLRGLYMPTGFTPNNDGKNDLLKPTIGGEVEQYKFTIMNRWGEIVFQTTDLTKGWDGRFKGLVQDGNVYVWTCSYQLAGETLKLAKGTFILIR